MNSRRSKIIGIASLAAFALAVLTGLFLPQLAAAVKCFGTIYVNLLKAMIVPVLFFSITASLASSRINVSGITLRTILLFILMFVVSFLVCSGLWTVLRPGEGVAFQEIVWEGELTTFSFANFLTSLFPDNYISAMSANSILPVIIFAFAFGIVIRKKELTKLAAAMTECNTAFGELLSWIMCLTPLGVFSLMSNTVADYGGKILGTAAIYIGCAWLGCLVIALLVMILPVWVACGISPLTYIKKVYKIWLITLTTCSSAATLPNTVRVCTEEFEIPVSIANLVVPLGCTIHMCGGAVSFSLLALFSMQMSGMSVGLGTFCVMLLLALVINMGAPGIPGGGIVIGATFLSTLGIPITFIGFYAGIYRLLDMAYTTMNVCGDITACILINNKAADETI